MEELAALAHSCPRCCPQRLHIQLVPWMMLVWAAVLVLAVLSAPLPSVDTHHTVACHLQEVSVSHHRVMPSMLLLGRLCHMLLFHPMINEIKNDLLFILIFFGSYGIHHDKNTLEKAYISYNLTKSYYFT